MRCPQCSGLLELLTPVEFHRRQIRREMGYDDWFCTFHMSIEETRYDTKIRHLFQRAVSVRLCHFIGSSSTHWQQPTVSTTGRLQQG
jgi:hypothetical protein